MARKPPVYGLDIETDTTVDGLDPGVAAIVTVALSGDEIDQVFTGDEVSILSELDHCLREIRPGVLATWNGSAFDLPFIDDRAQRYDLPHGLSLRLDASISQRHPPLPGHDGVYRAKWYGHRHLDAYRVYCSDVGPSLRMSCSLKSIARLVGLRTVEVDRERIHDLSHEALHAYAASDARLARILTERRWSTASRHIDDFDRVDDADLASAG
ncbi:MAG TPA: 3'-5' exonuclease [Acidimicrobiales bacterium]|nr:3'-5' exonuclease [Acidimicrobiales bacterium]